MDSVSIPHVLIIVLVVALMAALVWLVVAAIISIARSPGLSSTARVIWILACLLFPFLGSILWFLVGRGSASSGTPVP